MLTASTLYKSYSKRQILNGIEWSIKKGVHALIGPNGAGKSTFLRILAGCEHPSKGEIMIDRTSLRNQPDQYRQSVGYLPQNFRVDGALTVEQFMHYAAVLKGMNKRKERKVEIERCLNSVQMMPTSNFKLRSLTSGMLQRIGIAQALINNPEILIVDEPMADLDPVEQNIFRKLIFDYGKNKTVLLSTNSISDIYHYFRSITIMKDGSLIYKGSPQELADYSKTHPFLTESGFSPPNVKEGYLALLRSFGNV